MSTNRVSYDEGTVVQQDQQSLREPLPQAPEVALGRSGSITGPDDADSRNIEWRIKANIERVALPVIRALRPHIPQCDQTRLNLLEKCLTDITGSFMHKVATEFAVLTARELNICYMIANGMSSKEIAGVLGVGDQTIIKYRKVIRKKLKIDRQSVNLALYLKSVV